MRHAEQVERLDVVGIDRQRALVAGARRVEPSGAVMGDAGGELRSLFGGFGCRRNGAGLTAWAAESSF
jgi:hypothetical protein